MKRCVLVTLALRGHASGNWRGLATNQWRKDQGLTWDEWFQEADDLMREKYAEEA